MLKAYLAAPADSLHLTMPTGGDVEATSILTVGCRAAVESVTFFDGEE